MDILELKNTVSEVKKFTGWVVDREESMNLEVDS